jgi:hypothetical protein
MTRWGSRCGSRFCATPPPLLPLPVSLLYTHCLHLSTEIRFSQSARAPRARRADAHAWARRCGACAATVARCGACARTRASDCCSRPRRTQRSACGTRRAWPSARACARTASRLACRRACSCSTARCWRRLSMEAWRRLTSRVARALSCQQSKVRPCHARSRDTRGVLPKGRPRRLFNAGDLRAACTERDARRGSGGVPRVGLPPEPRGRGSSLRGRGDAAAGRGERARDSRDCGASRRGDLRRIRTLRPLRRHGWRGRCCASVGSPTAGVCVRGSPQPPPAVPPSSGLDVHRND